MLQLVARTAFLAWNRGDLALIPDIFDDPRSRPISPAPRLAPTPFTTAPEGHCRAMEVWNDAWREWDGDIEEVIDEGRDQVLIIARVWGEGATSGMRLDAWGAVRYTFRDGRILRVDAAMDSDGDRALDALGAVEAAGPSE
jgi:ketosteroid isomerase-like protein